MTEQKCSDKADKNRVGSYGQRAQSCRGLFHSYYIQAEVNGDVEQSIYGKLFPFFFLRQPFAQNAMGNGQHKKACCKKAGDTNHERLSVLKPDLGGSGGRRPEDGKQQPGDEEKISPRFAIM